MLMLLLQTGSCLYGQSLLVNGSFEDENVCTEYEKHCAPEAWICSSYAHDSYFISSNMAQDGEHYMGIDPGYSRWMSDRTYIRSQLLCRLRKGNEYRVEFYLKSRYNLSDSVGIYFTSYDFLFEREPPSSLRPSMYVADGQSRPVKNDTGWQKVVMVYKATGEEAFMTIGCFSLEHTIKKLNLSPKATRSLIYIDHVSFVALDPKERLCPNWEETKEEIYAFDMRHQQLDRYIEAHENEPPPPPDLALTLLPRIDTLVLPDIFFETAKSSLTPKSSRFLDSVGRLLSTRKIDSMVVEGHTDSVGKWAMNRQLSADRASTVASYFQKYLARAHFITRGWASDKPVADNRTAAGRQRNRRVEIYLYLRE